MDPILRGAQTELRFLDTLKELHTKYPELIVSYRQSSPAMDARGIDFLVRIQLPDSAGKESMSVPIEVKSSKSGVVKWKVVHRDLYEAGVLIFYIPTRFSQSKLRRLIRRALRTVQRNSEEGMLYHSMFQRLFKRKATKNLYRNKRLIRKERARRNKHSVE